MQVSRTLFCAVLAAASLGAETALAHAIAGDRVFPVTLTMDDPGVADEATFPELFYTPGNPTQYNFNFEYDKTITPTLGINFNYGFNVGAFHNPNSTQFGWQDLTVTLKDTVYVNAPHEFLLSVGLAQEIGGAGTTSQGANNTGTTSPTVYFGKGLGDLPIGMLRPLAITGEAGWQIANKGLKVTPSGNFNDGTNNQFWGGLSLQYSIPYLQSQVHDYGLPSFLNLIPLVEFTWTSPTSSPSLQGPTYQLAPGVIYLGEWYELGLEALIPLNQTTGTHVGMVAEFHLFFDDIFPNSIGKPIFP